MNNTCLSIGEGLNTPYRAAVLFWIRNYEEDTECAPQFSSSPPVAWGRRKPTNGFLRSGCPHMA